MNPSDTLTLEISFRDAARVYAVLGHVTGRREESVQCVWQQLKAILDPYQEAFDEMFHDPVTWPEEAILHYAGYEAVWWSILLKGWDKREQRNKLEAERNALLDQLVEIDKQLGELV